MWIHRRLQSTLAAILASTAGVVVANPASVSPVFVQPERRVPSDCAPSSAAVDLGEDDAIEILWNELKDAGLGFERRPRVMGWLPPIGLPVRGQTTTLDNGPPLVFDLYSPRLGLGVIVVGLHNLAELASDTMAGAEGSVGPVDTLAVAQLLTERLRENGISAGVFYDPLAERVHFGPGRSGDDCPPRRESADLLRSQIEDFVSWASATLTTSGQGAAPAPPSKDGLDAALAALRAEDTGSRLAAVWRLGAIGSERACSALIEALIDGDLKVRRAAVRSLGWCGSPQAFGPLIEWLAREGWDPDVGAALMRIDPEWKQSDEARGAYARVWQQLIEMGPEPPAGPTAAAGSPVDAECRALHERAEPDDDPSEVARACLELQQARTWETEARLTDALWRLDPERAAEHAIERLAWPHPEWSCLTSAEEQSLQSVSGPRWAESMLRVLPGIRSESCLDWAIAWLQGDDPKWRDSRPARAAADALLQQLANPNLADPRFALHALAELRDRRAAPRLIAELVRPRARGQDLWLAARDLARLATPEAIEAVVWCSADTDRGRRLACVRALAEVCSEKAVPVFKSLLSLPVPPHTGEEGVCGCDSSANETPGDSPSWSDWWLLTVAAIQGLTCQPSLPPEVAEKLLGNDPYVRSMAVDALAERNDPASSELLVDFLRTNPEDDREAFERAVSVLFERRVVEIMPFLRDFLARQEGSEDSLPLALATLAEYALDPARAAAELDVLLEVDPRFLPPLASELARSPAATPPEVLVALLERLQTLGSDEADRSIEDVLAALSEQSLPRLPAQVESLTRHRSPHVRALSIDLLYRVFNRRVI